MYYFRWNEWNIEHIGEHGIVPTEAEYVVNHTRIRKIGDGKFMAVGRCASGEYIQVIFIIDEDDRNKLFVIHARPLSGTEKRAFRRKR